MIGGQTGCRAARGAGALSVLEGCAGAGGLQHCAHERVSAPVQALERVGQLDNTYM